MIALLIALIAFVVSGLGLTHWLRHTLSTRATEAPKSRDADLLASLHWREFARLVLKAMHARGLDPVIEDGMPADGIPTNGNDILLQRNGERVLLSCKYGTASVVGAQPLLGLSKAATLRGASRVIVVTPGRFDEEAVRLAHEQDIELIDGETLWPEVRPYVPHQPEHPPAAPASSSGALPGPLLAWGGAALIGGLVWMLAQAALPASTPEDDMPPPPPRVRTVAATPAPAATTEAIPTDPAVLEQRRREAANSISTLFGVDRALWSSQSTLLVYLSREEADPINELCPLLERYPELAASRIQLQPPAGSKKPVRFKQCRTF